MKRLAYLPLAASVLAACAPVGTVPEPQTVSVTPSIPGLTPLPPTETVQGKAGLIISVTPVYGGGDPPAVTFQVTIVNQTDSVFRGGGAIISFALASAPGVLEELATLGSLQQRGAPHGSKLVRSKVIAPPGRSDVTIVGLPLTELQDSSLVELFIHFGGETFEWYYVAQCEPHPEATRECKKAEPSTPRVGFPEGHLRAESLRTAVVILNGQNLGTTPVIIKLEPNRTYTINFRKDGYNDATGTLTTTAETDSVVIDTYVLARTQSGDILNLFGVVVDIADDATNWRAWKVFDSGEPRVVLERRK